MAEKVTLLPPQLTQPGVPRHAHHLWSFESIQAAGNEWMAFDSHRPAALQQDRHIQGQGRVFPESVRHVMYNCCVWGQPVLHEVGPDVHNAPPGDEDAPFGCELRLDHL